MSWQYYGTKTLQVVPYMPGTPVYRDVMLPHLFFSLKKEEKIAETFCGENKNLDDFVTYFNRIKTMQVLCRVKENLDLDPVGMSWVDLPRGVNGARACQCGMAFFGDAARTPDAQSLSRMSLAYAFEEMKIDVFHGVQLASNLKARNFSMKLGFRECARVPRWHYMEENGSGGLVDARVMILDKSDFMPEFEKWHAAQERPKQKAVEAEKSLG